MIKPYTLTVFKKDFRFGVLFIAITCLGLPLLFLSPSLEKEFEKEEEEAFELANERNQEEEEARMASGPVALTAGPMSAYLTNISNTGLYDWTGAINCIEISEVDSNHMLAGAANGGVWISNNRGSTWQPVNDFANSLKVVSMAQNHFRHQEYYYSSGVDIYDNGVLLNDLYRSTDGGATFSNITTSTASVGRITKILCSPVDSNTIYFSQYTGTSTSQGRLYRTTDNFNTFQEVLLTTFGLDDFILLPNGEVEVASYNSIWNSPTGNPGSFVLSNTGIASNITKIKLTACTSQPLIRYAAASWGNYTGVYKTVNGGGTWVFIDTVSHTSGGIISVKPNDPDFLMFGAVQLYASTNGGVTWQISAGGYDNRSIRFDPHRPGIVFITSDFGISSLEVAPVTATSFTTEKTYDHTLIVQEIYSGDHSINGSMSVMGMQDLGSKLQKNNSIMEFLSGGDGAYVYASKQDSNKAYCSSQMGMIARITNMTSGPVSTYILNQLDANNDFAIDEGATFIHPYVMNDANDQQLYFPTLRRLWRSVNSGSTWTPVSNYYGNMFSRFCITATKKANPIVYWSNYDSLFILPNAATAAPLSETGIPVPEHPIKIIADPDKDSCVYLLKEDLPAKILYSSNLFTGPVTWTNLSTNFPADVTPLSIAVYPGNNQVIFIGTREGGMYITTNRGLTWSREINFPFVQIRDIKIRAADNKIFIYTFGRGVFTANFVNIPPLPFAAFSATRTLIYQGQSVTFNDASIVPTSWSWNFGDATTGTAANPVKTYHTPGIYTVTLTINGGASTASKTSYIKVLPYRGVPYLQANGGDFETNPNDFIPVTVSGSAFERGNSTVPGKSGVRSGSNAWVTDLLSTNYANNTLTYLYTPNFNFTAAGTYTLKFYCKNVLHYTFDGFRVEYTVDTGATWLPLGTAVQTSWYDYANLSTGRPFPQNQAFFTAPNSVYTLKSYLASALQGNNRVGFRIVFGSDASVVNSGVAFDDFELLGPVNNALPVMLTQFTGERLSPERVKLSWITRYERDNMEFELQRSDVWDTGFETVAHIPAKGNSNKVLYYGFEDRNEAPYHTFYRLKQIDADGSISLSDIISVKGTRELRSTLDITILPFPDDTHFRIMLGNSADATLTITGADGKTIRTSVIVSGETVDMTGISPGIYFFHLENRQRLFATKKVWVR